jgi:hypothetical protein
MKASPDHFIRVRDRTVAVTSPSILAPNELARHKNCPENTPISDASSSLIKPSKPTVTHFAKEQKDKDKEFFQLTLLSQLINHKLFNLLKDIDKDQMYERAVK